MRKPDHPSLTSLSPAELQARRRQAEIRRLLMRRLPLITYESFLQRLAGLRRHHPAAAETAALMSRRAAGIRLAQDLELARALEDEYRGYLDAQGLEETWYESRGDEAALLDRHLRAVKQALDNKVRATPVRLRPAKER